MDLDILALQNILEEANNSNHSDDELDDDRTVAGLRTFSSNKLTPANIPYANATADQLKDVKIGAIDAEKQNNLIWAEEELLPEEEAFDVSHNRLRPKFEILYKQSVMAEDVFFGTEKDPSSNSCDTMVFKISFPEHKDIKDLDLDVTKQKLIAQSSTHYLSTYLPYEVNAEEGRAKWDASKETLFVALPIVRQDAF